VCRIEEEHLWESKQLGAHSPHVLLNTLVYFNTKHFMLQTPAEHLALSFSHIMKHWKKTSSPSGKQGRSVYLRYYSPAQSSTHALITLLQWVVFRAVPDLFFPIRPQLDFAGFGMTNPAGAGFRLFKSGVTIRLRWDFCRSRISARFRKNAGTEIQYSPSFSALLACFNIPLMMSCVMFSVPLELNCVVKKLLTHSLTHWSGTLNLTHLNSTCVISELILLLFSVFVRTFASSPCKSNCFEFLESYSPCLEFSSLTLFATLQHPVHSSASLSSGRPGVW